MRNVSFGLEWIFGLEWWMVRRRPRIIRAIQYRKGRKLRQVRTLVVVVNGRKNTGRKLRQVRTLVVSLVAATAPAVVLSTSAHCLLAAAKAKAKGDAKANDGDGDNDQEDE